MKHTLTNLFLMTALMMILSSCASIQRTTNVKGTTLMPDITRLDIQLEDIEYLGDVEISYQSRQYLWIFRHVDSINNEKASNRLVQKVSLQGFTSLNMNKNLERAAVKAVQDYPSADFFVPVNRIKEVDRMFMGRIYRETMRLKAYRFKH